MARVDGTYFLMVDYSSSDGIWTHHIPIQYENGEAHLLMCDYENECWVPVDTPIMNFGEMTSGHQHGTIIARNTIGALSRLCNC